MPFWVYQDVQGGAGNQLLANQPGTFDWGQTPPVLKITSNAPPNAPGIQVGLNYLIYMNANQNGDPDQGRCSIASGMTFSFSIAVQGDHTE